MARRGAGATGVCLRRGEPARPWSASRDRHPGNCRRSGARAGPGNGDLRRQGRGERAHDHDPDGGLRRHAPASRLVPGRRGGGRGRGPAGRDRRHEWGAGSLGPVRAARRPAQQRPAGLPRSNELPAARRGASACAERAACARSGSVTVAFPRADASAAGALAPGRCAGRRIGAEGGGRAPVADTGRRAAARRACPRAAARCSPRERPPAGLGPSSADACRGGRSCFGGHSARDPAPTRICTNHEAMASRK